MNTASWVVQSATKPGLDSQTEAKETRTVYSRMADMLLQGIPGIPGNPSFNSSMRLKGRTEGWCSRVENVISVVNGRNGEPMARRATQYLEKAIEIATDQEALFKEKCEKWENQEVEDRTEYGMGFRMEVLVEKFRKEANTNLLVAPSR